MSSKVSSTRTRRSARVATSRSVANKSKTLDRHFNRAQVAAPAKNAVARVTRSRSGNILSLNDDCVSKILSHLDLPDLFALDDSYRQFSYLIYLAALKKFRENGYLWLRLNKDFDAEVMLQRFGRFFTHLCVDGENSFLDPLESDWNLCKDGRDLGSMMKHCTLLTRLKFRKVSFRNFPAWKLRNVFRNIETLEIENSNGIAQKIASMLGVCKQLKHLVLGPIDHTQEPSDLFSSITAFGMDMETICLKMDSTYEAGPFLKFLKRLQPLEKLKILEMGLIWEYPMTSRVVIALASIDSLEELHLRRFIPNEEFFQALNQFTKLNVCKLHTNEIVSDGMMAVATNFSFTTIENKDNDWDLDYTQTHYTTTYAITLVRNN